uniref:Uncharacterized protein n=1 Tax=Oryza rufipogon TaxID=4529 RepID=A0A0E0RAP0_ORYRU
MSSLPISSSIPLDRSPTNAQNMDASATKKAAASDEAENTPAAATAAAEVVTGVDCADDAAVAATTVDGDGGDEKQQQPSVKLPMPQEYVDYILAWKKRPFPLPDDGEMLSPEHRKMREEMAATCNELGDSFEEFQAEVRRDVEERPRSRLSSRKDGPRSTGATSSSPTGRTSTTPIAIARCDDCD